MMANEISDLHEVTATRTLFEGTPNEIRTGKTFYWRLSVYSEGWNCWTIALYHKIDGRLEFFDRLPQYLFSREINAKV